MTSSVETTDIEIRATIGVDTHAEVHVAVALDQLGRRLGAIEIPTTESPRAVEEDHYRVRTLPIS